MFALHGIKFKKGQNGYLNVSQCPWCGHGTEGSPNYQCGVRETPGGNNNLIHSYKCHHPHHSPDGDDTPPYVDVLAHMGALSQDEAHWVKNLRSDIERQQLRVQLKNSATDLRLANPDFRERLSRRLRSNQAALDWLYTTRGFSPAVVEHFQLGLSEPYTPKDTTTVQTTDALAAPLLARDGKFYSKYVNYAVPGVTVDNRAKQLKSWSAGPARTYFSEKADGKKRLFVCDGLKDLWALWDKLRGTELGKELLLVSSTNGGSGFPEEWKVPGFWEPWETVFLGHDSDVPDAKTGKKAGDEHAKSVAKLALREMRRVWPIGFKDWNDFFLSGKTVGDFEQLLAGAYPLSLKELKDDGPDNSMGLHAAAPVAISGSFHAGMLYEAVDVLERTKDEETGEFLERYKTLVVRSDGTLHSVRTMPAPKGTKQNQLVHRLYPDGTLLDGPARPSPYCSWSWSAIQAFAEGKAKPPALAGMLLRIRDHLKASVWLPFTDDYTLLACTVVATYVQSIFDAVPLLLATGAAGTGKTQLGIAMSEICANSPKTAIGQISAASIARLIDQSRGFVVLDDLESVGANKRNGDAQFDELIQALKLSYNKQSAIKYWTNMKTNALERLNFFGIKLINNTRGVDSILGTRMFTISTRRMPDGEVLPVDKLLSPEERAQLRDDLHTWAFTNVGEVSQGYAMVFPNKTTRSDEIAAPLKVVALLSGNDEIGRSLEAALARQAKLDVQPETPEQVLREALEDIIVRSFTEQGAVRTVVTITELMMRMALLVDTNYGKSATTDLSDIESPEVVGRHLKQNYTNPNTSQIRVQLFGKFLRGYELDNGFILKTLQKHFPDGVIEPPRNTNPKDFCRGCSDCDYRNRCEIRSLREAKERPVQAPRNGGLAAH